MKHKSIHISIPKPCHENWDKMDATEQGAFCHSCSKEVIDFSTMTDSEVIEYISKHKSGCGRFREDQVNKKLTMAHIKNGFLQWRALLLGIISIGAFKTLIAALPLRADMSQYDEAKKQKVDDAKTTLGISVIIVPASDTIASKSGAKADSITIHGRVLDHWKQKFEGASVEVSDSGGYKPILRTTTDKSGNFTLTIGGKNITDGPLILKVSNWEYRSKTITLNKEPDQEVTITLDEYAPRMLKGDYKSSR